MKAYRKVNPEVRFWPSPQYGSAYCARACQVFVDCSHEGDFECFILEGSGKKTGAKAEELTGTHKSYWQNYMRQRHILSETCDAEYLNSTLEGWYAQQIA